MQIQDQRHCGDITGRYTIIYCDIVSDILWVYGRTYKLCSLQKKALFHAKYFTAEV